MEQAVKMSLRLEYGVHAILQKEAKKIDASTTEYIQRILLDHARNLDPQAAELQLSALMWKVVDLAVEVARQLCRENKFGPDITYRTLEECMKDPEWAADYQTYVQDNPYKNGNPRKGTINKELGWRIKQGIGGRVVMENGKPANVSVTGSIIQSYTPLEGFDDKADWMTES